MAFWACKVRSGIPSVVEIPQGCYLQITSSCLEKNDKEAPEVAFVYVTINGKKLLVTVLDPVFHRSDVHNLEFFQDIEVSHSMKNGTVNLYGTLEEKKPMKVDKSIGQQQIDQTTTSRPTRKRKGYDTGRTRKKRLVKAEEPNS